MTTSLRLTRKKNTMKTYPIPNDDPSLDVELRLNGGFQNAYDTEARRFGMRCTYADQYALWLAKDGGFTHRIPVPQKRFLMRDLVSEWQKLEDRRKAPREPVKRESVADSSLPHGRRRPSVLHAASIMAAVAMMGFDRKR